MRMMAPAISGAAVILVVVLVATLRPHADFPPASGDAPESFQPVDVSSASATPASHPVRSPAADSLLPAEARAAEARAGPVSSATRSPLPGETPPTPMASLMPGREVPPELVEGERAFAAEPIDAAWAPGAEADLLAKFAQMPGLTLIGLQVECRSTMCRLELLQPDGAPAADGSRPFNILLDSVGLEPRWMLAIQGTRGPMRSVAYLWREGFAPQQKAGEPHLIN